MSHRKADVDIDDEDVYVEEVERFNVPQLDQATQLKIQEVRACLARNDTAKALFLSLKDTVRGGIELDSIKTIQAQAVYSAVSAAKPTEIGNLLKSLSTEFRDNLLHFVYKMMKNPETFSPAVLLVWHKEIVDIEGLGAIVRVLTARVSV